jgi:hypothetical protein
MPGYIGVQRWECTQFRLSYRISWWNGFWWEGAWQRHA